MTENAKAPDPPGILKTEELLHFLDVPMSVNIELGNAKMKIREILQLTQGSIMELPRSAGENIDVYVNGQLLACGEVLELEGNAGVRLTDILLQCEESVK